VNCVVLTETLDIHIYARFSATFPSHQKSIAVHGSTVANGTIWHCHGTSRALVRMPSCITGVCALGVQWTQHNIPSLQNTTKLYCCKCNHVFCTNHANISKHTQSCTEQCLLESYTSAKPTSLARRKAPFPIWCNFLSAKTHRCQRMSPSM
jgi:hypothetical protein